MLTEYHIIYCWGGYDGMVIGDGESLFEHVGGKVRSYCQVLRLREWLVQRQFAGLWVVMACSGVPAHDHVLLQGCSGRSIDTV